MRYAQKRADVPMRACRLGEGAPLEAELLRTGQLRRLDSGDYEVFSQEAVNGRGEIVRPGDYVKLDAAGVAYPNDHAFFEACHIPVGGDLFVQRVPPRVAWLADDPLIPEVRFLLDTGRLTLRADTPERYFRADLWGAPLSAARDAVLMLYAVARDDAGAIVDVTFNFVARDAFERTYDWCDGPGGEDDHGDL